MPIAFKLGLSFLAMICGIAGLGYFSVLRIEETASYIDKIYNNPLQSISFARAAQNDFTVLAGARGEGDFEGFLADLDTARERAI